MESKKSPKGNRKRTSKGVPVAPPPPPAEDHYWDCSVCTFRNNAEAFKCSMCDVRKGTSTRKPRINPDLVAAQQAQALTPPPPATTPTPSSSNSTHMSGDEGGSTHGGQMDEEAESAVLATLKSNKKGREPKTKKKEPSRKNSANSTPRLKNVDRGSATYHSVTVNDFTVVITEFKPRIKKEPKKTKVMSSSTVTSPGATSSGGLLSVDDNNSRNSRSPSVSGDGIHSDENSRPNGNSILNTSLDTSSGF